MKATVVALVGVVSFAIVLSIAYSYSHLPMAASNVSGEGEPLLIYCGITMIKPMCDLARIYEEEEGRRVVIIKGGSGEMFRALKVNESGDLFLPGSDSFIAMCREKGLITETALVGYNRAALMVQKGNPKHITARLENLADPKYYVVISDPKSGGIGLETEEILKRQGLFESVTKNARQFTSDSKDLIKVLRDKEADLVINWGATATWPECARHVEVLRLPEEIAPRRRLELAVLRTSRDPAAAARFMRLAASPRGNEVFKRYGFFDAK